MNEGVYKPTWESLDAHPLPEWFDDAKLGMFVDWGLYSIGAWAPRTPEGAMYPDWYLFRMYEQPETKAFHAKTFGADFQRDDFIPLFTAAEYDPEAIAQLAVDAGMKYIVPFCKHHDGFCLWDCEHTKRNAVNSGAKRDLIKPLVAACEKHALKFGFYYSVDEWEYPVVNDKGEKSVRYWSQGPVRVGPYDETAMKGKIGGKIPVHDFVNEYIVPQANDFITKYDPDLIWFDGEWDQSVEERHTRDIVSYFYNHAEGRKLVAVNDRYAQGTRAKHGDFYTSEFHDGNQTLTHKWEECRSIGQSYGFNRDDTEETVLSSEKLVHLFVDIVSEGGNFLLMVNLTGSGAVPEMYAKRLKDLGAWLKVNGEAIYATRQFRVTKEDNVRFTRSKDGKFVYAITLGWPGGKLTLKSLRAAPGSRIEMLGVQEPVEWKQDGGALTIAIPDSLAASKPCECAFAFKIQTD